jgi:hypothetical protein
MEVQVTGSTEKANDIVIHFGDDSPVRQPRNFRCCPLGIQFYTENEIDRYSILDFKINLPSNPGTKNVNCSGAVVHCDMQESCGLYRIWLYFLDLPEDARPHLHCFAKESNVLCPFCENF